MTVTASETVLAAPPTVVARVRTGLLALWAAITGTAPHVLHHLGPLAGTALVAGGAGRALFGLAGFVATIPMLRRLRRRTGSWRAPVLTVALFVIVYAVATLFLGPVIGSATSPEAGTSAAEPGEVDHHSHDVDGA